MSWRALLASPLGFLIGLSLGALGGGGSILAVPALVYGAGQDPKAATTTSLLLVGMAAVVGSVGHFRAGRVKLATGVAFGLCGIGGSLVGSAVNRQIDPDLLLLGFAGLVMVAAWRMVTGCPTCTAVGEAAALAGTEPVGLVSTGSAAPTVPGALTRVAPGVVVAPRSASVGAGLDASQLLKVLAAGTAVGLLTGLFGVGGGFVIVPALALVLKLPMPQAIGTSLVVIAINSAVAFSTRIATSTVEWSVTIPFAVAAIAGVLTGGKVADTINPTKSLRWFAGLLVSVAVYTAIRSIIALT